LESKVKSCRADIREQMLGTLHAAVEAMIDDDELLIDAERRVEGTGLIVWGLNVFCGCAVRDSVVIINNNGRGSYVIGITKHLLSPEILSYLCFCKLVQHRLEVFCLLN